MRMKLSSALLAARTTSDDRFHLVTTMPALPQPCHAGCLLAALLSPKTRHSPGLCTTSSGIATDPVHAALKRLPSHYEIWEYC